MKLRKARGRTIRAEEAQVETLKLQLEALRDMTPMKIGEYFRASKLSLRRTSTAYKHRSKKRPPRLRRRTGKSPNFSQPKQASRPN